jgi:hypothetical protein
MSLVAQRAAAGGGQEGSSAMDKLREAKGKAKLLVSEVRPLTAAPADIWGSTVFTAAAAITGRWRHP